VGVLKPGHCFTIEPMICEGVHQELMWYDMTFSVKKNTLTKFLTASY
jgi:methionyl aminopeptidase